MLEPGHNSGRRQRSAEWRIKKGVTNVDRITYLKQRQSELRQQLEEATDPIDVRLIRPLLRAVEQELAELGG